MLYTAGVHDERTALAMHAFGNRTIPVREFLSPRVIVRAAWVSGRSRRRAPAVEAVAARGASAVGR